LLLILLLQLEYKALQDKLRSVEDDVRRSADKFSELQRTFESERLVWTNDKKTLEDTIVDLSTSEKTSETDRTTRESEVRKQEERALVSCYHSVVIRVLSFFRPQKIDTRVK
jgi:nucleoprotein TPR